MNQKIELLEKSKSEIITLEQAKEYLRIDHSQDDNVIMGMIEVAFTVAENYTGKSLLESKWQMSIYSHIPSVIKLFYTPILKIEQIKIYFGNREPTLLLEKDYYLDPAYEKIYLNRSYMAQKIEIQYVSGYSINNFPSPIRQGILEHLSKLYDVRGADQTLPLSAKELYQYYKKMRFYG